MIKNIILPLALLATAQAAMAQADPELDDVQLDSIFRHYELEEVVVTGTRTPKFLKDTPIQTRVITSRDIARTDATNVQDLLQQELPGVEFSYSMNQQTHLNFAGFGGQGIVVAQPERTLRQAQRPALRRHVRTPLEALEQCVLCQLS